MDKVQHFEIPADDLARARKFYETAFNWKTSEFSMPGGIYIGLHTGPTDEKNMVREPGFINGGMFERNPAMPAKYPNITVTVDDIDAALEKITSLGGTIVRSKQQIADMGLHAYVQDTEGNTIGVWQNAKK